VIGASAPRASRSLAFDQCHVTRYTLKVIRTFADTRTRTLFAEGTARGSSPDYGLTVAGLADAVGVSRQSINELLSGRRAVSPEMALRLARLFGNSPEFC